MSHFVFVRHTVAYFPHWKTIFDRHQKNAHEYGLKTLYLFRDLANCNIMTILLEAKDLERAKEFMTSKLLKDAMKQAGVIHEAEIYYLSDVIDSA